MIVSAPHWTGFQHGNRYRVDIYHRGKFIVTVYDNDASVATKLAEAILPTLKAHKFNASLAQSDIEPRSPKPQDEGSSPSGRAKCLCRILHHPDCENYKPGVYLSGRAKLYDTDNPEFMKHVPLDAGLEKHRYLRDSLSRKHRRGKCSCGEQTDCSSCCQPY